MRFSKKIGGFFPEEVFYPNLPDDLVDVDMADYEVLINNTDPEYVIGTDYSGYPVLVKTAYVDKSLEEKAVEQYAAIDNAILSKLKEYDYDSVGELALAASGGQWQSEAQKLNSWIQECWEIMDKVKKGVIIFESVHDALLSLPE